MGRYTEHLTGCAECQEAVAALTTITRIKLVPEPDNSNDPRAIQAVTLEGRKIGNLERDSLLVIAILDHRLPVASRILEIKEVTPDKTKRVVVLEVLTGQDAVEALARSASLNPEKGQIAAADTASDTSMIATLRSPGVIITSVLAGLSLLFTLGLIMAAVDKRDPLALAILPFFLLPGLALFPPLVSLLRRKYGIPSSTSGHLGIVGGSLVAGFVATVVTMVALEKAYPELAAKQQAAIKARQAAEQAAEESATRADGSTPKDLDREDMLTQARAALKQDQPERGLAIIYENATPDMLQDDSELKALISGLESKLKIITAPDEAKAFAERVQTYWLPQLNAMKSAPPTTAPELWNAIAALENVTRALEDAAKLPLDADSKKAHVDLRNAIILKQRKLFPVLRSAYSRVVGQALWENDIDARVGGSGNRSITWTGAIFAARANIASAQEAAQPHLLKLRFKRSTYEWVRGAGQTWTYDLDAPTDDAVGYWSGSVFLPVK